MSPARINPPFRADHVGSLIRPRALIEARQRLEAGQESHEAPRALEDAAIRDAVAMQERVGLQSITDGEMRRFSWRDGFFESVDGFSRDRVDSSFTLAQDPVNRAGAAHPILAPDKGKVGDTPKTSARTGH
jgi:methionine synthase II (cobalamin-independent)